MFDWSKQTVLITGGTGSFGQAFTRYILKNNPPKTLRIYSRDEYKQFEMSEAIKNKRLRYFIGDVRDKERLKLAMEHVTVVIHAAAMKQIVTCEYNPTEAISTNVLGSMNVFMAALDAGVERLIGLITDKAVSPINLYGATKLCAEKLLIQDNSYRGKDKTIISCVRYGNVIMSRGSVIPMFLKQKDKGIITVTHQDMTRFWITLDESVKFVIHSIESMVGGEVFIPKMPSFRVVDLAKIIAPQARIRFIGIRPGEKLHEDIITLHESANIREFKDFYILKPSLVFWKEKGKQLAAKGKPVPVNFSYNSFNNNNFLSQTELKRRFKTVLQYYENG